MRRMWGRGLQHNVVSWFGGLIMLAGVIMLGIFLVLIVALPSTSAYIGIITYMVMPGIILFGLAVFLYGMRWESVRRRTGESTGLAYPVLDFNEPRQRHRLQLAFGVSLVGVLLAGFVAYNAFLFTEEVEFCGELCHSVMHPEYTTYQYSPHANVLCVECHVGPGASWYVRSKLAGVRQVFAVWFNTYPQPIRVPISDLRPAEGTCLECHWPFDYVGAKLVRIPDFGFDEQNTAEMLFFALHVGGGQDPAQAGGIHWHVDQGIDVMYAATDELLQEIPWVKVAYADGTERVYVDENVDLSQEDLDELPQRTMDCIDCHNRPTHIIGPPDRELDDALSRGDISPEIPSIKEVAYDALIIDWESEQAAEDGIPEYITSYYEEQRPQVLEDMTDAVDQAIEQTLAIWQRSVFPQMNVTWDTYPNNIGHKNWPGCFRCHNGEHVSEDGRVIGRDCNICHTNPRRTDLHPLEDELLTGSSEWHPFELQGVHTEIPCSECHAAGSRPSESCVDCHGFNTEAPHIGDMPCTICHLEGQQVEPLADCTSCHPNPPNWHTIEGHASLDCTACHPPHTFLPEFRETCLECHPQMANPEGLRPALQAYHQPGAICRNCHRFGPGDPGVPLSAANGIGQ